MKLVKGILYGTFVVVASVFVCFLMWLGMVEFLDLISEAL